MKLCKKHFLIFFFTGMFFSPQIFCQVRLPQLIGDGMVLQRNAKVNIWGWATPGEKVTVKFIGKSYTANTNTSGKWLIVLPTIKAGGPYNMDITASNKITIKDVLLGDVWFCSGQSNMVIPMERVKEKYPEEIAQANYPQIRNFFVPTVSDVSKVYPDLPPGKWIAASPQNVLPFGAATYFFAKKIYNKYHVPIGIINSSVGGTPIQAWISADGFKELPQYANRVNQFKDTAYVNHLSHPVTIASANSNRPAKQSDIGLNGPKTWFDTTYVPHNWTHFWLPGYWADQGIKGLNGVVWFRKEITVPAEMAGKPAKLFMGRIVDADFLYVNGVLSGSTSYQYPPRRYDVATSILKPGKNIVVVRVINTSGKGGFVPDKPYYLIANGQKIDLRGDWEYKVGQVYPPVSYNGQAGFSAQNEPTGLYNTMVAPAINYTIKGFLWYQGETNTGRPAEYKQLLPVLITDWRSKWQEGQLPFIYAQLPNFMEVQYTPSESQWAELREAQLKTLSVPGTAMAVAIDAGEWNDIHPLNKKDVGERLALAADKLAYGDGKVVSMGPIYQSAKVSGDNITITFTNTGSGLMAKGDDTLMSFAIAGADKKFSWAKAKITGNQVVVSSENVPNPVYVRYAWADNPANANLYNKKGLPASPFRTDSQ